MDDEAEETPVTVAVRIDYYNDIMEAADIGFVALVERRRALDEMLAKMPHYPERDGKAMKSAEHLIAGIALSREDVQAMRHRTDNQVKRLAEALNARYAPGVAPRYKA